MNGRPRVVQPIVHPTKCCVQHHCFTTIVPHIHPSHTQHINHHMYQHMHYYPHTESVANEVSNQHFNCGARPPGPFMGR
nr:spore coat protein [Fredinandcohnia onubensis]